MTERLFGTDGIRGRAGEFPLNAAAVAAIGCAIGEHMKGRILIGQDTRISSPWILDRMHEGFRHTSARIEDAGVIPTPAIALLTKHYGYDGGVMISASHNPYEDNGIKVFAGDGRKLCDDDERRIEQRIFELVGKGARETVDNIPGTAEIGTNTTPWPERYLELLRSHFPQGEWMQGMHVVADCANGATSAVAPQFLRSLGARVTVTHAEPSGTNINESCGAVHWEGMTATTQRLGADLGVAFDGDGDRSMFASSSGRLIDGDAVLLLMARRMMREGRMNPPVVVGTQMTNYGLERTLTEERIELKRVAVGDRFIFEEMLRSGAIIGGEPSGHIIFSDFRLSGDGLLTTLKVAQAMAETRASLDDLTADWHPAPQLLKGVRMKERIPLEDMPSLRARMGEVEQQLAGRGRVLIRYSGTEPLLRVMIESDDATQNDRLMKVLLETIQLERELPR